jgi:hypothetical protein
MSEHKVILIHGQEDFDHHIGSLTVVFFVCEMSRPAQFFKLELLFFLFCKPNSNSKIIYTSLSRFSQRPQYEAESLKAQNKDIQFLLVDMGESQDVVESAGIHRIFPSFQFYKEGAKVDEHLGPFETDDGFENFISKHR